MGDLGKSFGALRDPVPHPVPWHPPPSLPTGLRPGELESLGQKARSHLLRHSSPDDQWLNCLTNGPLIDSWLFMGGAHCGTAHWLSRTTNGHP